MKTIFIFNDSRPTDHLQSIVALGEDGQRIGCIRFDDWTAPHCQFAMGAAHLLREDDPDIADQIHASRAALLRRYEAVYGIGNWMPMWLDAPQTNAAWRRALYLYRQRQTQPVQNAQFGNAALGGILGAIFNSADSAPHTTH